MSCRRGWNDEFLDMNFTKAFRTGPYKKHREEVLLDREVSLLPTRQPRVEATLLRNNISMEIDVVYKELAELEKVRGTILLRSGQLNRKLTRYTAESEGRPPPAWTLAEGEKPLGQERAKFIMKCPDSECRGFLSTAYKCGTCQKWSCPDCLIVKGLDKDSPHPHTCDPGQKESVALIIKESKACPKCGERISKIDGCDQMWCIDCHTAFSWVTGAIVNGIVHNPHYYEYLRKQGGGVAPRNAGDVVCGGIPYYRHLTTAIAGLSANFKKIVERIHRVTSEIADQRVQTYQGHFNVNDNGDLGVLYLMQKIDKECMKQELVKRELKRNKHLAIRAILEMFVNTSTMMLNEIVSTTDFNDTKFLPMFNAYENLRIYVNDSMLGVSKMKNCSVPLINDNWQWSPFNKYQPKARTSPTPNASPTPNNASPTPAVEAEAVNIPTIVPTPVELMREIGW